MDSEFSLFKKKKEKGKLWELAQSRKFLCLLSCAQFHTTTSANLSNAFQKGIVKWSVAKRICWAAIHSIYYKKSKMAHRSGLLAYAHMGAVITEDVRKYLTTLRENLFGGDVKAIYNSYQEFEDITEKTFKVSQWPVDGAVIKALTVDRKHCFERCEITRDNTVNTFGSSWQNYINLFNYFIACGDNSEKDSSENNKLPDIPNTWLWDIINSFISQFQYFHNWRFKPENVKFLQKILTNTKEKQRFQSMWNVQQVLRYLHVLVGVARISLRHNAPISEEDSLIPVSNTLRMVGFFSLIGLLRVNTMIGDYRTGLETLDPLDLRRKSALTRIDTCYITAQYHLAFCYLMTRRWIDAHHTLTSILQRYQRKAWQLGRKPRKQQEEELTEQDIYIDLYLSRDALLERSYALLAVAHALVPRKLDEKLIGDPLEELFSREMSRIKDGNEETRKESFESLFSKGCPNLINVTDLLPDQDNTAQGEDVCIYIFVALVAYQFEAFYRTLQNRDVSRYKEELKLYCTIPVSKLSEQIRTYYSISSHPTVEESQEQSDANETATASESKTVETEIQPQGTGSTLAQLNKSREQTTSNWNEVNPKEISIEEFQRQLLQLKLSMRQFKRIDATSSAGEWSSDSNFDFYIEDDIVHVIETKTDRLYKYSNQFLKQIRQLNDWMEQYNLT
ncbi:eukaryotic translation initiation factor 3 subunit 6 interacting protein [Reticulomyxa filosa]|uniref:Eukaryotic translation initiation factor 3 subunit 6 interacting protein n=1 Tax=Reticulomyxa filosa TaxID=46433 RepID=X6NMF0_RETFI|nr:eukaryotic translation initiation factor 3 subunit 6 interacting protein [Reticulomyxa filosa]|eukprot:ETO26864.1 eukaryotic translation initiation factor 3 subunit 6 interacting protein [Reticulomyxa filosa]